jgi:hypothetical protein
MSKNSVFYVNSGKKRQKSMLNSMGYFSADFKDNYLFYDTTPPIVFENSYNTNCVECSQLLNHSEKLHQIRLQEYELGIYNI